MSKTHTKQDLIKRTPFYFSIETSKLKFAEDGAPEEIQVLMIGKWNHPAYGPIIIDEAAIKEFKENFDSKLRRDIPVTEGHESFDEKPAIAWFTELINKGADGLWAKMSWTPKGKTLLAEKAYKYFSPEFFTEYEDPETREIYKHVLVGGALTNKPYFKKMSAVVLSEKSINKNYILNFSDMDLKQIVAKKIEELTTEEIAFLKEHKEELSTEDLAKLGSVLEDKKPEETEEEKANRIKAETEADNVAKGLNPDGTAKDVPPPSTATVTPPATDPAVPPVTASEKNMVQVSASEYKILQDAANAGKLAFAELRKKEINAEVAKLVFSEQNSAGRILPKDEQKVFSFMQGLTKEQRKCFTEIVKEIPATHMFKELGKGTGTPGTAYAEITTKIEAMQKTDPKMKYSDALKRVVAENPELGKRYEEESNGKK